MTRIERIQLASEGVIAAYVRDIAQGATSRSVSAPAPRRERGGVWKSSGGAGTDRTSRARAVAAHGGRHHRARGRGARAGRAAA